MTIRARVECRRCGVKFTPDRDNQVECGECKSTWAKPEPPDRDNFEVPLDECHSDIW
jgi:DNA-directed RNA polymerase subunit RPC12/RpoP